MIKVAGVTRDASIGIRTLTRDGDARPVLGDESDINSDYVSGAFSTDSGHGVGIQAYMDIAHTVLSPEL